MQIQDSAKWASPGPRASPADIDVTVASRRPPEALASQAQGDWAPDRRQFGRGCTRGFDVILAVPFAEHRDLAKALSSWEGKTIIDATNAYGIPVEELGGLPSSAVIAKAFAGAKLVKGFNHLPAAPWLPIRSSSVATASSFCRATTRPQSLRWRSWPTARVCTRKTGKIRRGWRCRYMHVAAPGRFSSSRICSRRSSSRSTTA